MKAMLGMMTALWVAGAAGPALAGPVWWGLDRVEDRIDRRESMIDREVTLGAADLMEDRLDARESRADRRNLALLPRIDRHERRSVRRILRSD